MKAVIPAAGHGTRMRPYTDETPKPMLEYGGKPILERIVECLKNLGVDEIVMVVGHLKEEITKHFGDGSDFGVRIEYAEQPERMGLAHAILQAEPFIDGDFIVHHGDNLFLCDNLGEVVDVHLREGADATIGTLELEGEDLESYRGGFVVCEEGRVVELVEKPEKPPCATIYPGFSVLDPKIFDFIRMTEPSARGEYEMPDAVNLMLKKGGKVIAVPLKGERLHFTRPEDLES